MRFLFCFILMVFLSSTALSQEPEDYLYYKMAYQEELLPAVESDTLLFYRAAQQYYDTFHSLTSYSFSFVDYARRGLDYTLQRSTLDGITLPYSVITTVRRLGAEEYNFGGLTHGEQQIGSVVGTHELSLLEGVPLSGVNVGLFFSGKGYLGGARASVNHMMNSGWSLSAYLSARGGNDLYIKGVYDDAVDAGLRLTKDLPSGNIFSTLFALRVDERGLRSGSTAEAFTLVGDNLYNPTWGRQQGKIRNSRVRRDAVPFLMTAYSGRLGENTSFVASLGGEYSLNRLSMLSWYDAMTPRPDNYRYLPSYFANDDVAAAVAERWRAGDERYTQINWADMYEANRRSANGAVYTLDDGVERSARGEFAVRFKSEVYPGVTLSYGLRGGVCSSRRYKQMRDIMQADYLVDLDYYLLDDDTFSNNMQNDLCHPDRRVGVGDRYAYDYALREYSASADVRFEYRVERWRINVDAEVGRSIFSRRGYYEKELFSGGASLGRSKRATFNPYTLKLSADYLFSMLHRVRVSGVMAMQAPSVEDMFLNPQYNNRLADNLSTEQHLGLEADYRYSASRVDVGVTAYIHSQNHMRQVMRTYDDLSALYCDVDVEDMGTISYGMEATAVVSLSQRLRASMVAAAGRYTYSHNPRVTHYADTDNSIISLRSESKMQDCFVGGTPQVLARASLDYFDYQGWGASCSLQYAACRYVEASFVRRTARVLYQASTSQEIFDAFMHQERLPDAFTVDVSVSRRFKVGAGNLSAMVAVRNVLGSRNIVQYAYEPSRLRNHISGAQRIYEPHSNILTYAYPRNIYLVVSWKF